MLPVEKTNEKPELPGFPVDLSANLSDDHPPMTKWISRHDWPGLMRALDLTGLTVDIGAGAGGFTGQWQSRSPSRSHMAIDLWQPRPMREWPHYDNRQSMKEWKTIKDECSRIAAMNGSVELLEEDGVQAAERFPDGAVDAVWLDASHNYSFVRDALSQWWPKLRTGGMVGGASCINRFHKLRKGTPMWIRTRQAVEDFAREKGCHLYTDQEEWPCYLFSKADRGARIAIVSGSTSGVPWVGKVRKNHESYCAAHGYSYRWMEFDFLDYHPVWGKIFAVAKLLEENAFDWVVWLDSDAVFVDFAKPLSAFLIEGADAVLPEWTGKDKRKRPSSGVMIWRNTECSRQLLRKIWRFAGSLHGYGGEEEAMCRAFRQNRDLSLRCILVDHRHFNSMMSSWIGWYDSRDFIVHIGQVESEFRCGILEDLVGEAEVRGFKEGFR